jgi:hypothetical protein
MMDTKKIGEIIIDKAAGDATKKYVHRNGVHI